jgi:hypothetical protein
LEKIEKIGILMDQDGGSSYGASAAFWRLSIGSVTLLNVVRASRKIMSLRLAIEMLTSRVSLKIQEKGG